MPFRKPPPAFAGEGRLRFAGHEGPVRYVIAGDPARLREGTSRLRAALTVGAEVAEAAFRAGDGVLTLEDGARLRAVMLAHSAGGDEVHVELRV